MTDRPTDHQQHDPVGDRVRSALHIQLRAEEARVANGVASPERSPRADRRSPGGVPGRLLIAAAAVVVVAAIGIGLAVSRQGGDQRLETANGGPTTTIDDPEPGPGPEGVALADWAGRYEWVEFVDGDPGSDQTLVHDLVLDEPTGDAPTELTGTFVQNGFQTATDLTVLARPVDTGVAIEVVTAEGLTSLRPGDVAFTLTGDPAAPLTTIGALIPLQLDLPATGIYFVTLVAENPTVVALPPPDPDAGFTRAGGYAVAQLVTDEGEIRFVALDLSTAEVAATFYSTYLEAAWYSPLQLAPTGHVAYLTQGFEDYWFSCDSVLPDLLRLDLDPSGSAEPVEIGQGAEPRVSPDGTRLAYLTASDCIPDPQDPGNWVLAPLDTIVVRDLASGEEARHTTPGIVDGVAAGGDPTEAELRGLVWLGDDRLGVSGGDILDAAELTPIGDRLPVLLESGTSGWVVGYEPATGSVLVDVVVHSDTRLSEVHLQAVELATGRRVERGEPAQLWEGHRVEHALDATGRFLLTVEGDDLILPDETTVPLADWGPTIVSIVW